MALLVEDVTPTSLSGGSSSLVINMPATVNAGELLIIHLPTGQSRTISTLPSGWTQLYSTSTGTMRGSAIAKVADGSEAGGTVTITMSGNTDTGALTYRISGFAGDISTEIDVGTPATSGGASSVNAPSVSVGWTSGEENLFLIFGALSGTTAPSASGPTVANYTNYQRGTSGAGSGTRAWAVAWERLATLDTDNPAASSSLGASYVSVTNTIVIRSGVTTQTITHAGVASGSSAGSQKVNLAVNHAGVPSAITAGTPVVAPQAVTIAPNGVAASSEVGELVATFGTVIALAGIPSAIAAGAPQVRPQPVTIEHEGVDSGSEAGSQSIASLVQPTGVQAVPTFGTQVVAPGAFTIGHEGVASGAAVGTQKLNLVLVMTGVASGEVLGALVVDAGSVTIAPNGVASGAGLGALVVLLAVTGLGSPPAGTTYSLARLAAGSSSPTRQPPGGRSGL